MEGKNVHTEQKRVTLSSFKILWEQIWLNTNTKYHIMMLLLMITSFKRCSFYWDDLVRFICYWINFINLFSQIFNSKVTSTLWKQLAITHLHGYQYNLGQMILAMLWSLVPRPLPPNQLFNLIILITSIIKF
jgi:hypothetical protein